MKPFYLAVCSILGLTSHAWAAGVFDHRLATLEDDTALRNVRTVKPIISSCSQGHADFTLDFNLELPTQVSPRKTLEDLTQFVANNTNTFSRAEKHTNTTTISHLFKLNSGGRLTVSGKALSEAGAFYLESFGPQTLYNYLHSEDKVASSLNYSKINGAGDPSVIWSAQANVERTKAAYKAAHVAQHKAKVSGGDTARTAARIHATKANFHRARAVVKILKKPETALKRTKAAYKAAHAAHHQAKVSGGDTARTAAHIHATKANFHRVRAVVGALRNPETALKRTKAAYKAAHAAHNQARVSGGDTAYTAAHIQKMKAIHKEVKSLTKVAGVGKLAPAEMGRGANPAETMTVRDFFDQGAERYRMSGKTLQTGVGQEVPVSLYVPDVGPLHFLMNLAIHVPFWSTLERVLERIRKGEYQYQYSVSPLKGKYETQVSLFADGRPLFSFAGLSAQFIDTRTVDNGKRHIKALVNTLLFDGVLKWPRNKFELVDRSGA